MNYQSARNSRREARTLYGRFGAGKLAPVFSTLIFGEFISIFVPIKAVDALKDPTKVPSVPLTPPKRSGFAPSNTIGDDFLNLGQKVRRKGPTFQNSSRSRGLVESKIQQQRSQKLWCAIV